VCKEQPVRRLRGAHGSHVGKIRALSEWAQNCGWVPVKNKTYSGGVYKKTSYNIYERTNRKGVTKKSGGAQKRI